MGRSESEGEPTRELDELRARVRQLTAESASAARDAARYRLLLEHLNVGVFVSSLDGRMLECNDRTLEMAGESREALLDAELSSFYEEPNDRQRLVEQLRARGAVRNFETWTRHRSGKRVASSMNAVLAPIGPDGAPLILGMLEDITDRKLAEQRAGRGEELFRVIAEQSMLGILIFQNDSIRFVNQAASDMCGYSIEEIMSWNALDYARVIHPEDVAFVAEQGRKKQARDPSALAHYTYRAFTKSGELRWIEQYSRAIDYDGGTANFVMSIDITSRKLAEQSLAQLSLTMERTAKLEALGVLAAGIAHDFNNLLGGLFGHVELARERVDPASSAHLHLDLAQAAFERAKGLTGQLLAFAKGGAPVRRVGSVAACVRQCAEFALSGGKVSVELDLEPELWSAEYDSNQLGQAFDNLLINAKQAMPNGGKLRIIGRNVEVADGPRPELEAGRYVKLSFVDDGPGIAPAIMARVFDPFFTTKAEGSGVGLTAAYAILKKHDGHIDLESRPGEGATFHVWLPAVLPASEATAPKAAAVTSGRGLVLVMDDDDIVRHVAGNMLAHLGYTPILTSEGSEALERTRALLAEGKRLSAAMLDLTVRAGQGGRDIAPPLRQLAPEVPIIASSGYSDDPVMAEPARFEFDASLHKPFRLNELSRLLTTLIEGRRGK